MALVLAGLVAEIVLMLPRRINSSLSPGGLRREQLVTESRDSDHKISGSGTSQKWIGKAVISRVVKIRGCCVPCLSEAVA